MYYVYIVTYIYISTFYKYTSTFYKYTDIITYSTRNSKNTSHPNNRVPGELNKPGNIRMPLRKTRGMERENVAGKMRAVTSTPDQRQCCNEKNVAKCVQHNMSGTLLSNLCTLHILYHCEVTATIISLAVDQEISFLLVTLIPQIQH